MGFYQPFTIVKDAQRHGLRVRPVDVTRSEWLCTLEEETGGREDAGTQPPHLFLRLGLCYVKGLRE
jgi:error-prone DNA polymerase